MSLSIINTALELGLITSLVVLSLFLSYQMLNVCDLSTDGCFTFGASVGAVVAVLGHPTLSLFAALCAGAFSGLTLSVLQCYLGIDSLLAGIIILFTTFDIFITIITFFCCLITTSCTCHCGDDDARFFDVCMFTAKSQRVTISCTPTIYFFSLAAFFFYLFLFYTYTTFTPDIALQ